MYVGNDKEKRTPLFTLRREYRTPTPTANPDSPALSLLESESFVAAVLVQVLLSN